MAIDNVARALAKSAGQATDIMSKLPSGFNSGTTTKPSYIHYAIEETIGSGIYAHTVSFTGGKCNLFSNTTFQGYPKEYSITNSTVTLIKNIPNYICAKLNSNGTVTYTVLTDRSSINFSNNFPIFTFICGSEENEFSLVDWDSPGYGLSNKILARLIDTTRFERASGFSLGETGTRYITVSSGIAWQGVFKNVLPEVSTATTKIRLFYTDTNGSWVTHQLLNSYPNTQYDTGHGLADLTDGTTVDTYTYAVLWVFRNVSNTQVDVFLGSGDYTLTEAIASQVPSVPEAILTNTFLVGRIIVKKGDNIATNIDGAWTTKFTPSITNVHNNLMDKQGGEAGKYYHSNQEINTDSDVKFNTINTTDNVSVGGNFNVTGTSTFNGVEMSQGIATFENNINQKATKEHRFYNTGDTAYTSIDCPLIDGNDAQDFRVRTKTGTFYVDSTGKFGNTANPTANLHVVGDGVITGDLDVQGTLTYTNVENINVENKNVNLSNVTTPTDTLANGGGVILKGTTDKTILWNQSTGNWELNTGLTIDSTLNSATGDSLTLNGTSASINMQVGGNAKATLTETGLGIGTTTPDNSLHIYRGDSGGASNTNAGLTLEDDTSTYIQLLTPNTNSCGVLFGDVDSNNAANITFDHNTNKLNSTVNSITSTTIDSVGNVGIGTTSPTTKLEVNGYTKLGSDAPSIKLKRYTGLMPAIGQSIYVSHGLTNSKIINYACVITDNGGTIRIPNSATGLDIEYAVRIRTEGTIWLTTGNSGTLIAGGTYNVLIWYIE